MPFLDYLRMYARDHRRVFVGAAGTLAVLALAVIGSAIWFVTGIFSGLPPDAAVRDIGTMSQSTTLYDVQGRQVSTIFKEQRIDVPLSRVSPHLVQAILAIEDQRFYDHRGVDIVRIAGAAWMNVREGWGSQGASTITQQLARQTLLTREKTLQRKLREVVLAARIESAFSKDEILELYLNKVYFGAGLYGAEAASLGYFGKHAADLEVPEAALLAGLVKAPSTTAPTVNLEKAIGRRNAVLRAMRDAEAIDDGLYERAVQSAPVLVDALRGDDAHGQYFWEEVRKQLVEKFGWEQVYEGGLRVYTTLDLDMQKAAETEVNRAITDIERRRISRRSAASALQDPLQAALVALDPRTGEVRALVGGRDYETSRFNRVTQARRQPGSAFKPFVYAAALESGYTPASIIPALDTPIMTLQGAWVPDDHSTSETMTMRTALRSSSNRAAVSMLQEIGIPAAVNSAKRLGVGDMPRVWSLALGSGEVTLLSMTSAYAAFANQGMVSVPTLIRRVEAADGQVLFTSAPQAARGVSEATAFLMTSMLSDVINAGTGWQARNVGFTLPAAGKTGTTNDYHDAWFVGYTPNLATGVWVGYDQPRTIIGNGYAGDLAVPLWGRFMATATQEHKHEGFSVPATVRGATICRLTGKLATDGCRDAVTFDEDGSPSNRSSVYTEYFVHGTEPTEYCEHGYRVPAAVVLAGKGPTRVDSSSPTEHAPTAVAGSPGQVAAAETAAEPPAASTAPDTASPEQQPRKRGFWSKVFGRGK
jgi:1A family penicillin-binding protein